MTFIRDGSLVYRDGPPVVKGAFSGVVMLAAAFWAAFTHIVAALLILFFLTDLASGILKDIDKAGGDPAAFRWSEFWRGIRKFGAAIIGCMVGVGGEVLFTTIGLSWVPAVEGVMGAMAFAFFWSTMGNLAWWFPWIPEFVASTLPKHAVTLAGRTPPNPQRPSDDPEEEVP